jgi:hypothetical protein
MKESHRVVSLGYNITAIPDEESINAIKVTFVKKGNKAKEQKETGILLNTIYCS